MSDNTLQFRWIVTIQGGLDAQFSHEPMVFIAGDLLWYPVEGDNTLRQAPDILVAFGRPKGDRGSYRQWEEGNIAPQVVWEVLSPGNRFGKMLRKFRFYERYGVEEYYVFDPDNQELTIYFRVGGQLQEVEDIANWVSPRLGIRFDFSSGEMKIIRPDGRPFATYVELAAQVDQERQRTERLAEQLRALGIEPQV